MSTQIQQQQVQGLVAAVSDISANAGNLANTGATLSAALLAAEYRLDTDIETVSGDLLATGAALSSAIVSNTNSLILTGYNLTLDINKVSGNLVTSGAYLTTTIIETGALLTTNLIATGATLEAADAVLSGNLVTTGATLTNNLIATGATLTGQIGTVATNLRNTGTQLQSEIVTLDSYILQNSGAANYANYSLASDFRLNDYVLQTSLTGIPTGTLREASSVCYNPSGCTYLVLTPEPTSSPAIKEIEFGGTGIVRSTRYTVGVNHRDVEGITHVTGNQFALCSEYNGGSTKNSILLFDYIGNSHLGGNIPYSDFTVYNMGSPYGSPAANEGLEGISYDPQKQVFYGAFEGGSVLPWKVLEISLDDTPNTTTGELFDESDSTNWPTTLEALSDIYYDPNSKHLFLTDHGASTAPASISRVFECDLEGNFIDYVDLKDSQGNNYNQIEGITFSPDGGRMVIAGEAKLAGITPTEYGSDLGFYTISSIATSGAYKIPAVLPAGGVVVGNRTLSSADHGTYIHCDKAAGLNLYLPYPDCSGQFDGFKCDVFNEGAGAVAISAVSPGTFKALTSSLATNEWAKIWCLSGVWFGAGDL